MADWGETKYGDACKIFRLESDSVRVALLDYGCIIQSLQTTDKDGNWGDIVTGFDTIGEYHDKSRFFGCVVGRVANRTANGKFNLNDETYTLAVNNGPNHLHGGLRGWDKYTWKTEGVKGKSITFTHTSADGDEGYPCELQISTTYTLDGNCLKIEYSALNVDGSRSTPVNMTNHSYFNLGGHSNWESDLSNHHVKLSANFFTPVSDALIPTGEIKSVSGTDFDLRAGVDMTPAQLATPGIGGNGYDHNYAFGDTRGIHECIRIKHSNGRNMKVCADVPGMQFYTGNFVPEMTGKSGTNYGKQTCFCTETQAYPNAVNEPVFPTNVIGPKQTYKHTTEFHFNIADF